MYALHENEFGSSSEALRKGHLKRNLQQAPHLLHSPILFASTSSTRLVANLLTLPPKGPFAMCDFDQ